MMKSSVRLADIMDLDYLIHLDQKQDIRTRTLQNRRIYQQYALEDQEDWAVLMTWLSHQRKLFRRKTGQQQTDMLPSEVLALICRWMTILLAGLGFIIGAGTVISFLTYQGDVPVNVTVFILIFMGLPLCVLVLTLIWLLLRQWRLLSGQQPAHSLIFRGLSWLMLDVLPGVLLKTGRRISAHGTDKTETAILWFRMKFKEYQTAFFWSFFMLTSLTGLFFASGLLTGMFFKVLTSDVAFGWQSTLISTATGFHRFVSAAALPWSWLVPESLSHPSLEQIEGTRIVLKEGISILATADLVSWWPFLCFGLLCYGIIPRILITGMAFIKSRQAMNPFDFGRLCYRELLVGMQSPSMDIDTVRTPVSGGKSTIRPETMAPEPLHEPAAGIRDVSRKTVVLASQRAYPEDVLAALDGFIARFAGQPQYLFQYIRFDFQADRDLLTFPAQEGIVDGIILHEVWQPPIRGLLHYLDQVQTKIFPGGHLWILLTPDSRDLSVPVEPDDMNFQVWKKAVLQIKNPNIDIIRYQP